jgi:hypothetical protein
MAKAIANKNEQTSFLLISEPPKLNIRSYQSNNLRKLNNELVRINLKAAVSFVNRSQGGLFSGQASLVEQAGNSDIPCARVQSPRLQNQDVASGGGIPSRLPYEVFALEIV